MYMITKLYDYLFDGVFSYYYVPLIPLLVSLLSLLIFFWEIFKNKRFVFQQFQIYEKLGKIVQNSRRYPLHLVDSTEFSYISPLPSRCLY